MSWKTKSNAFSVSSHNHITSKTKKCTLLKRLSEILVRIINHKNYESVLEQLREYISEVDEQFVARCLKALGNIAIRYEKSIEKCLGIIAKQLSELKDVAGHAEQVVNQMLIVLLFANFRHVKTFLENILQNTTLMECSWIQYACLTMLQLLMLKKLLSGFQDNMPKKFIQFLQQPSKDGFLLLLLRKGWFNQKF